MHKILINDIVCYLVGDSPPLPIQNSSLYLDHQNITYKGNNLTLAWKPTNLDCSMYEINFRNNCGFTSLSEKSLEVSSRNVIIFIDMTSPHILIENKNGENPCQWMNATIQFDLHGNFTLIGLLYHPLKLKSVQHTNIVVIKLDLTSPCGAVQYLELITIYAS